MKPLFRKLFFSSCAYLLAAATLRGQTIDNQNAKVSTVQTVTYCEVLEHPDKFKDRMIRVRALYETDFEKSVIVSPSCPTPDAMTWVSFEKEWKSRTARRVRHGLSNHWGVQIDVVLVGAFKSEGNYGHMGVYPFSIQVYKVEAASPSGHFRPLPGQWVRTNSAANRLN